MTSATGLVHYLTTGLRAGSFTATSTTDAYELLLIQLLNQAKDEVEEAWDWLALRTTVTLTITSGTSDYALTAAGPADVDVGIQSRLLYEKQTMFGSTETSIRDTGGMSAPQVFDTTDSTEYRLQEISVEALERMHLTDDNNTGDITYFALYKDGTSMRVKVYPTPNYNGTVIFRFVIPQAVIPASSMGTYTLSVPAGPVWKRALASALRERGDEDAYFLLLQEQADQSLFSAIAQEQTAADVTGAPV